MYTDGIIVIDDAGITPDGAQIDTQVNAQKGHRVWQFLKDCQAEFSLPGKGTQLVIPLYEGNLRKIKNAFKCDPASSPAYRKRDTQITSQVHM
jgi:hypothetical protein